jgi:DNA repair exonuclease SbcCD nuclease subunit
MDEVCSVDQTIQVVYVVGNHDAINNQIFLTDDHFFNAFKGLKNGNNHPEYGNKDLKYSNLVVADRAILHYLPQSDDYIGFIPYVPIGRFDEAYQILINGRNGKCRAIFAHQEFKGASFGGSIISTKGDEWPESNPYVISGHIHEHNQLKPNILYVGTPYQTNFGESPDKSISLITIDVENVSEERIKLNIPQKLVIQISCAEFEDLPFSDLDEVKIFIRGSKEDILSLKQTKKFKDLGKNTKVVFKPSDQVSVKKNANNYGFMQLIHNEIEKESDTVRAIFQEVVDASNIK